MADKWDEQIESDIKAGKLDELANQAIDNYKNGKSGEIIPTLQCMNESGEWIDVDMKPSTDLERFVELYKSFGIECIVNEYSGGSAIYLYGISNMRYEDDPEVTHHEILTGIHGTRIEFDGDGKFVAQSFP